MDPATDTTQETNKKRKVSFDPKTPSVPTPKLPTAIVAAKTQVIISIASLCPAIKVLAEDFTGKFIKLRSELHGRLLNKERLSKDDFVPKSAQFEFKLGTSRVSEDSGEFKTLAETVELHKSVFVIRLKEAMVQLADLEIKALKEAISHLYCHAARALAIAFTVNAPELNRAHSTTILQYTFTLYSKDLLRFAEMPPREMDDKEFDMDKFFKLLSEVTQSDTTFVETFGYANEAERDLLTPVVASYKELMKNLFVVSFEQFVSVKEQIVRDIETKKFVDDYMKSTATEATAIALEEVKIDSKSIDTIVEEKLAAQNKKLQSQISKLQKSLKGTRGARPNTSQQKQGDTTPKKEGVHRVGSNSNKKDKKGKSDKKGQSQKQDAPQVDAAAKGSGKGKKDNNNSSGNNSNKGKKKSTNKRGVRQS
jgi:hypothetical protein